VITEDRERKKENAKMGSGKREKKEDLHEDRKGKHPKRCPYV